MSISDFTFITGLNLNQSSEVENSLSINLCVHGSDLSVEGCQRSQPETNFLKKIGTYYLFSAEYGSS